jgi:HSP20 family protein
MSRHDRGAWRDLAELRARLRRALDEPLRAQTRRPAGPPLDFSESRDAYLVRLDVPGLRKDELAVVIDQGALQVSGELRAAPAGAHVIRRAERLRGPFRRAVPLPHNADPAAVNAGLADGVLTVRIGKRVPDGGRNVPIE